MTMIDEIAKLEKEIEQRKAKIKSIKEDSQSEMLNTIADAREECREAASKLSGLISEYQKMYPASLPLMYPASLPLTYPDLLPPGKAYRLPPGKAYRWGTKFRL